MRFGIFVHPKRPKIPADKIAKKLRSANVQVSQQDPDVAIVVGGDGTFGYYGRTLDMPMLFVGGHEPHVLGSRSNLAEIFYEALDRTLEKIDAGKHKIVEERMLSVSLNGISTDVLTDAYLERGTFSGCLRYAVSIEDDSKEYFTELAIGNGVLASSSFGSTGYFSYLDRLKRGSKAVHFSDDRIGICHIIPVYLVRKKDGDVAQRYKVRYTVPFHSTVRFKIVREADARLYGTTVHSRGMAVGPADELLITGSKRTAKIIKM